MKNIVHGASSLPFASAPRIGLAALMSAALFVAPVSAESAQTSVPSITVADAVEMLKPGEYIWAPQVAPEGPIMIVVSLQRQRGYIYRNGVIIGVSTVSTGSEGRETPVGITIATEAVEFEVCKPVIGRFRTRSLRQAGRSTDT